MEKTIFIVTSTSKGSAPSNVCAFGSIELARNFLSNIVESPNYDETERLSDDIARVWVRGYAYTYRIAAIECYV